MYSISKKSLQRNEFLFKCANILDKKAPQNAQTISFCAKIERLFGIYFLILWELGEISEVINYEWSEVFGVRKYGYRQWLLK